ncbi:MAG: hypothetical protein U0S50_15010 [Sphingopyxis sp.]|uniref:hypothetical protein n=1 Tax=Sphingopyxis sp. TaxID=1908224 RepID=UPI002ABBE3E0|nr:hypothetical protein [Sphingopyxis sp.]MDZ3833107.1 hypothetical protein [Sphingopyxis sp.]
MAPMIDHSPIPYYIFRHISAARLIPAGAIPSIQYPAAINLVDVIERWRLRGTKNAIVTAH